MRLLIALLIALPVLAEVKPRVCGDKATQAPTYMEVDACPGDEYLYLTPSCESTRNLPHCNPPASFTLPNPHAPAYLRVLVTYSGEIKRKGQVYWQYSSGGTVLWQARPFYAMP